MSRATTIKFRAPTAKLSPLSTSPRTASHIGPLKISSLKPSVVIALQDTASAFESASYMAAKRQDAVLITDCDGHLIGIITDKDLTYKLVAERLDPRSTLVSSIMTTNPISVDSSEDASVALDLMVKGHFRHLPVLEPETDSVVGMLDITKCLIEALAKLERVNESSRRLTDAINEVQREFPTPQSRYAEFLVSQLSAPNLAGLIQSSRDPPLVSLSSTVLEACRIMKEHRETAVLVLENSSLAGIFTSKDVVLRVLAAGLDPATTSIIEVMTPHPDCASPQTTVLEALNRMNAGRFLHLPVLDDAGELEGLVDVLSLTYATLDQLNTLTIESGPVWEKFWNTLQSSNSELNGVSTPRSRTKRTTQGIEDDADSVNPDDSASMFVPRGSVTPTTTATALYHQGSEGNSQQQYNSSLGTLPPRGEIVSLAHQKANDSSVGSFPASQIAIDSFVYKLKDPQTHRVHRFVSSSRRYTEVLGAVKERIKNGANMDGLLLCTLSYQDDDGDFVIFGSDADVAEAVLLARSLEWKKLKLRVVVEKRLAGGNGHRTFNSEAMVFGGGLLVVVSFLFGRLWQDWSR